MKPSSPPATCRDVSRADLTTRLFGRDYAMPFGVPPVGFGDMRWPDAEEAPARNPQRANIPYALSTTSLKIEGRGGFSFSF